MATMHLACPVCGHTLKCENESDSIWGRLDIESTALAAVTITYTPEMNEHMAAHMRDGSMRAARIRYYEAQAERSALTALRLREYVPRAERL